MTYKLVYRKDAYYEWAITMYVGGASKWIEQSQFLLRMDALNVLKRLNKFGHLI